VTKLHLRSPYQHESLVSVVLNERLPLHEMHPMSESQQNEQSTSVWLSTVVTTMSNRSKCRLSTSWKVDALSIYRLKASAPTWRWKQRTENSNSINHKQNLRVYTFSREISRRMTMSKILGPNYTSNVKEQHKERVSTKSLTFLANKCSIRN
jgi:hypothetical protein